MKLPIKTLGFFIFTLGLVLFLSNHVAIVLASGNTSITGLDITSTPKPTIMEATPTVDPATIGDTSGVVAIGMIVVVIILAGVLSGSLKLRQESIKNRRPKE